MREYTLEDRGHSLEYVRFLIWLWESCVETILHHLDYGASSAVDELPLIWWIGTGVTNSLPFHAAGNHSLGSTRNTFSRAISSYTPTLKALGYARERAAGAASMSDHQGS